MFVRVLVIKGRADVLVNTVDAMDVVLEFAASISYPVDVLSGIVIDWSVDAMTDIIIDLMTSGGVDAVVGVDVNVLAGARNAFECALPAA